MFREFHNSTLGLSKHKFIFQKKAKGPIGTREAQYTRKQTPKHTNKKEKLTIFLKCKIQFQSPLSHAQFIVHQTSKHVIELSMALL